MGDTSAKTILGILIGLRPADSDFILSEEPTSIDEGTSKTIKIRLAKKPESDLIVTITSNHAALEVNDSSTTNLTFTQNNYSTDQSFTIAALIDNNQVDESGEITISAEGYVTKILQIANKDVEGDWISFTPSDTVYLKNFPTNILVKLKQKPWEDIPLTLSPSIQYGITNYGPLTFTKSNYNIDQAGINLTSNILYDTNLYLKEPNHYIQIDGTGNSISSKALLYFNDTINYSSYEINSYNFENNYKVVLDIDNGIRWTFCFYDISKNILCGLPSWSYLGWQNAINFCNGLSLGGRKWRLPTDSEIRFLSSLIYIQVYASSINEPPAAETKAFGYFWTSTIRASSPENVSVMNIYYDPSVIGPVSGYPKIGEVLTSQNKNNESLFNCVSNP